MGRAFPRIGRASLGASIAPSRVRRVARGAPNGARGTSRASRRTRTGALDLRGASVVNGGGDPTHALGIPTKTSGCSPWSDGSGRGSSGSPTHEERGRRHAQRCFRSWDGSSRSSQSCRSSLCRRPRSSESVPPRGDGCSIRSDRSPASSDGNLGQHRRLLEELAETPSKKHGQLYAHLGTLCANLGTLQLFAGTPCEGQDGIREESRDPYALLRVPPPSRKRRRGRAQRPSQREATVRTHLGTPSMRFETPNEKRTMPTMEPGSRWRLFHAQPSGPPHEADPASRRGELTARVRG